MMQVLIHLNIDVDTDDLAEAEQSRPRLPLRSQHPRRRHRLDRAAVTRTAAQQLRSCADRLEQAHADRDYWVRQMRAEGASLRAIAETALLSHAAVAKILKRNLVTELTTVET